MSAPVFIVMGVSGCGKSSVGQRLAAALEIPFLEGDALHTPASIAKMAAGTPLADEDRAGWLHAIALRIAEAQRAGRGLVVSCSALKRSYRDVLREGDPQLRLVFLHGARAVLAGRMAARTGHYMPASLLDSQLATLEPPGPDERALPFDVTQSVDAIVAQILSTLPPAAPVPTHPT